MKELIEIEKSLEKLQIDFNSQLKHLDSDTKEFHNALIDLSTKYPDHKELLQFIVFVNDKLEINQNLFSEVVAESFNELIKAKKMLIQKMIFEKEQGPIMHHSMWEKTKNIVGASKNVKGILTALAVILLSAAAILAPQMFIQIIKELAVLL